MSSPAWMPWLIGVLVLALAVVSALAGALWTRARALPLWQVAQLARELAERQRALEEFLARLERGTRAKPSAVEVPARPVLEGAASGLAESEGVSPLSPALPHEGGGSMRSPLSPMLPHEGGGSVRSPASAKRRDGAHVTPPGPTLIAVPDLASASSREEPVGPLASEELQRRHGAVWELADAGARADQIASHLGLPVGHVELILGLRKPLATGVGGR